MGQDGGSGDPAKLNPSPWSVLNSSQDCGQIQALSGSLRRNETGWPFPKVSPSPSSSACEPVWKTPSTWIHTSGHRPPKQTPTLTSFQPGHRLSLHMVEIYKQTKLGLTRDPA